MAIDIPSYRRIMGNFATGVTVVTTDNGGLLHGLTANSVTGLSLEPLMLLVCVDRKAHAHGELLRAAAFGVNILAGDQVDVSNRFAKSAEPEEGSLRGVPFHRGSTGVPLVDGAMAHFECRPAHVFDGGDHTIFVGEVVDGAVSRPEADPLLYFRGGYRTIHGA